MNQYYIPFMDDLFFPMLCRKLLFGLNVRLNLS